MRLIFFIIFFSGILNAEEVRLALGETKILIFPGLKSFKNLNQKLVRAVIHIDKEEVEVTALSKGNGMLMVVDSEGKHSVNIIVYSKMALDLEREIKEATRSIEGITVKNVGHRVIITGNIYTPEDEATLKLIEQKYESILNLTQKMKSASVFRPEKMIQVELKMMELNHQKLRSLGIQFPEALRPHFSMSTQQQDGVSSSSFQLSSQFDMVFKALEQKGFAKILANPKLVCKNGGEAKFWAGGEIPIRLMHGKNLKVEWKAYGIMLHIFPEADANQNISVKLTLEISSLNAAQTVDGIPALINRKVETAFHVINGETIILSGLIHEENSEEIHRVPALSSLPILGELFQSKHFQNKSSELMIFVTPSLKKERIEK